MSDFTNEIDDARVGLQDVPLSKYRRWIHDGDLRTRARVYSFTRDAWSRIRPAPEMTEQCTFMADYLIECLVANTRNDDGTVSSWSNRSTRIESGAGGRELGAPPGAEASAVTSAFRRAPGGAVRGQDPDAIACFRFAYCGQVAAGSKLMIVCDGAAGIIGRR